VKGRTASSPWERFELTTDRTGIVLVVHAEHRVDVEGTVFDADGRPYPGALLWLHGDEGTTDVDGRYRIRTRILAGRLTANVDARDHRPLRVRREGIPPGTETLHLDLALERGATLTGRVLHHGEGAAGAMVAVRAGARTLRTQCDADGGFSVRGLGRWPCTVVAANDTAAARVRVANP
jgi:hypothetical protein